MDEEKKYYKKGIGSVVIFPQYPSKKETCCAETSREADGTPSWKAQTPRGDAREGRGLPETRVVRDFRRGKLARKN